MTTDFESKLLKAKIELMTRSAFISTIALSMKHIITTKAKTARVYGTTIEYNPTFIAGMSTQQIAFVMAHECWHVAFQHAARLAGRELLRWNVAGDYVINFMLNKDSFELPDGVLFNAKYDEKWSTDAVYDDIDMQTINVDQMMQDLSEEDPTQLDSEVADIVVRAKTQAEVCDEAGSIPGEIIRMIDKLLNPKLPWPVILNKFLDQRVHEEYSWSRRNRRFHSAYMPSMFSHGLGHLTFAIDTSGSIGEEELRGMLSEIQGIQHTFKPEKMTIIDCDARIHTVYDINQSTDIMSLKFHGGGGTRFQPVLDYVTKHPTQALVYFTDLWGESNIEPVDYPTLWISNDPDHEPSPIGETVYV
jgi:predicted metal-dependent peptidase